MVSWDYTDEWVITAVNDFTVCIQKKKKNNFIILKNELTFFLSIKLK